MIMTDYEKIRGGFYTAEYFNKTKKILQATNNFNTTTMQVFCKGSFTLCGIEEVIELFKHCTGFWKPNTFGRYKWINKFIDLEISYLPEGSLTIPWKAVLTITGPYIYFAHLESIYLGILSRSTKVATNTRAVVQAAKGKPILFFADRFDRYENQESDGYAAYIGGATKLATPAMTSWSTYQYASGTMPHALIAMYNGDVAKAALAFSKTFPNEDIVALVDFNNNCVKDALQVALALKSIGKKLYGVRLDTSEKVIDFSLKEDNPRFGVCPELVFNVRNALDDNGLFDTKIIVSGGFGSNKIRTFEELKVPVNMYGVGSSLLNHQNINYDFTADIVKPVAKYGRSYNPDLRLVLLKKIIK
jgi:nicotinate phosphoribosyltransferase